MWIAYFPIRPFGWQPGLTVLSGYVAEREQVQLSVRVGVTRKRSPRPDTAAAAATAIALVSRWAYGTASSRQEQSYSALTPAGRPPGVAVSDSRYSSVCGERSGERGMAAELAAGTTAASRRRLACAGHIAGPFAGVSARLCDWASQQHRAAARGGAGAAVARPHNTRALNRISCSMQ